MSARFAPATAAGDRAGGPAARRPGMVLVAAILLLLACALSFTAGTYIAAQAVVIASGRADAVRARLAAESAVRAAAANWRVGDDRALPLLGERVLPTLDLGGGGAQAAARVRRLGGELFLLVGEGRSGAARARAAALVRVLSIRSFVPLFPAAITIEAGRIGPAAMVSGDPPDTRPPEWPESSCDPGAPDTVAAVLGSAARPGLRVPAAGAVESAGAQVGGEPPIQIGALPPDSSGFGPLPWGLVAAIADRLESGTISPWPVVSGGECDRAAPGNWGAPAEPTSPCGGFFPLVFAPGDLRVTGGTGQGVLVVRGSLRMEAGARFFGPIIVAGGVSADSTVRLRGALRARSVDWGGEAQFSACTLLAALTSAPALGTPFRTGPRFWLPYF